MTPRAVGSVERETGEEGEKGEEENIGASEGKSVLQKMYDAWHAYLMPRVPTTYESFCCCIRLPLNPLICFFFKHPPS